MVSLEINNKELERHTLRLRAMHKSDLPIVVRQTLNDLAFDVKQNTLMKHVDKEFILRNPNFFKSHTSVVKAVGWDINKMQSEVGFIAKGTNVTKELRKQEYGGISKRPMIYVDSARVGNNKAKLVKLKSYINQKGIVKGTPNITRNDEPQFIANAVIAQKHDKLIFAKNRKGTSIYEVNRIRFGGTVRRKYNINGRTISTVGRKVQVEMTMLADYEENKMVKIKARPFLRPASIESNNKQYEFYIRNAEKRFNKIKK